jgi:pyruvate,orthophosphate dikinase
MVFGNMGETIATGVAFTRDPRRRARLLRRVSDQRAGRGRRRRHPHPAISDARRPGKGQGPKAASMEESMPEVYSELARVFDLLETHYRDMQDIEFTVERGRLFMLQTRSGKRTAKARSRSRSTWPAKA